MRPFTFRALTCMVAAAAITLSPCATSANLDWTSPDRAVVEQPEPSPAPPPEPGTVADDLLRLSDEELDDLLGPIALYPDVLLSAVLAAAVFPDQVAEAAVLVRGGATAEQLESQGWEDPVIAIAKVPEVIAMMGQYPDWTGALGSAFLIQSWDVMASVQRLRGIAFENGALQTTPQHIITVEQQTQHIIIAPANPTIIYVPRYDPQVIFVRDNRRVVTAGVIGFGTGIAVGAIIWGGSTNWSGGVVVWGRGGWWGWNNSNNRTNINIDNSRNTNININRPGGGGINRPGNINRPGDSTGSRPSRLPDRIGNEGNRWTPDRSRPGVGGSATGPGASAINRDRVNDWRANRPDSRPPGSSIALPPATRPGAGAGTGGNRPGLGGNRPTPMPTPTPPAAGRPPNTRPGAGNRPTPMPTPTPTPPATGRTPINRTNTLLDRQSTPTTRPGVGGGMASRGANTPISRQTPMPARPAGTPTTGNRTSAFSGGPGNAAANRGAASRGSTPLSRGGASQGAGGGARGGR